MENINQDYIFMKNTHFHLSFFFILKVFIVLNGIHYLNSVLRKNTVNNHTIIFVEHLILKFFLYNFSIHLVILLILIVIVSIETFKIIKCIIVL